MISYNELKQLPMCEFNILYTDMLNEADAMAKEMANEEIEDAIKGE